MEIKSEDLINDLRDRTRKNLANAEGLNRLDDQELNWRSGEGRWSVLECLGHLNYYGRFYLPEIRSQIAAQKFPPELSFKSGWLGNYFAESMLPKEKLRKIKTLKSQNPAGKNLDKQVINEFIAQQKELLEILEQARTVSLTRTKTGISISKWIKLRLGDTFRVLIYHNQRHLLQAANVRKEMPVATV